MDTDGPVIDPYTEVINPNMVITHAYDDDINRKRDSDSDD